MSSSSGQRPRDKVDASSKYQGGGEDKDKSDVCTSEERRRELSTREKLKEELLRQYEAGQLKTEKELRSETGPKTADIQSLLSDYKWDGERTPQPRQIPTIEEQRERAAYARRSVVPVRQTVPLPDLSRPPPGYVCPVPVPLYQPVPQPIFRYEDTIVTRVLQSLMGSRSQQQVELPSLQSQDAINKVISWDVGTGGKKDLSEGCLKSLEGSGRSIRSLEARRGRSTERNVDRSRPKKRRRSLSLEIVSRPAKVSTRRKRSRSKSRIEESRLRRESSRSRRVKSVERLLKRNNDQHRSRREASPLTRTCSMRTEQSSYRKRRYHESHSAARSPSIRTRRKIVLLSPVRVKKSVREVIMDERDMRLEDDFQLKIRSPVKKRVKDRLGVRRELPDEIEVYNMDISLGRCGAVAIVKEFIDSKTGILELKTSEGGSGAVILFSAEQIWVPDRKRDLNGPPKLYVESRSSNLGLETLFPVGQEILMNARKVPSQLVDMQATAVWPKFTEIPHYKITPRKLDDELDRFHEVCKVDKLVPVCINGLAPVGSLNIWSARVRQIVDKDWGIVEVKSVPRDGKREFSFRFFCIFNKSDVWLEEGIRVGEHKFYNDKPLREIVELLQPVDVVARSIVREKGLAMKKALGSTVEMQALCISLKPSCIPDCAPRGTRVDGGPGAFGGSNRGETPYMFKKGLEHSLNDKLAEYLQVSGKVCHNLDPNLVVKLEAKTLKKTHPESEKNEKKVHKLTKSFKPPKNDVGTVTVDSQNNVIVAVPVKPKVPLFEKLSNGTARVKKYCTESVGLLENLTKDWICLFQISDCVLIQGRKPQELYPVGTNVQLNANLIDSSRKIQYIASCVWIKSENALILPNIVEKRMISPTKISLYNEMNLVVEKKKGSDQPSHLDLTTGLVVKILDDNFGVIKQDTKMVLFDTCDFWTSQEATAAQSSESLPSLVSLGDTVLLHAALVQPSSQIPYLATAVWLAKTSPFTPDECPVAIRREKIHPDKIRIYEMVSRCSALKEDPPEIEAVTKSNVYDQKGLVKLAFKFQGSCGFSAAMVEFSKELKDKKMFAFYLANQSLESHEKTRICVPGTKVYFNAVPVGDTKIPVSHIATTVSHIHSRMPLNEDSTKIVEMAMDTLRKIMEHKPNLYDLCCAKPQVVSLNVSTKSKTKDQNVLDCFPTGRLVCMLDENAGILEDHRRELAYFEKTDLNLSSGLEMKDIVMVMTRCRDVTIRFQASQVLDGPVKMVVHNGTVAISSNLERYFPEVQVKKAKICMKPNSFSAEKITRAQTAVELYKVDKILTPDYIIDSGEFSSTLVKPKKFSSSSSLSVTTMKKPVLVQPKSSAREVKTLTKQTGKVKTILNDNFCLLEFCQEDAKTDYCLFDTFDLYLEGGRTAAQSKLTVANVLSLDMEVCFHACEISPGSSVPWLATGVWRPDTDTQPKPVPHSRITKEKVEVFKKVAETCSVLVSGGMVPTSGSKQSIEISVGSVSTGLEQSDKATFSEKEKEGRNAFIGGDTKESGVDVERETATLEGNSCMTVETIEEPVKVVASEDEEMTRLAQIVVKSEIESSKRLCQDESNEVGMTEDVDVQKPIDEITVKLTEDPCLEIDAVDKKPVLTTLDSDAGQIFFKTGGDEKFEIVKKATREVTNLQLGGGEDMKDNIGVERNVEEAVKAIPKEELILVESVEEDLTMLKEKFSPSLPEMLTDQNTRGFLDQEIGHQFAILSLDCPAGTKALLHIDRVWVTDHPMLQGFGWEVLTRPSELGIRVNARRVTGFEEFDYQVIFAHVGVSSFSVDIGEFSYTPELAKFAENKQEETVLDTQLKMFKEK